MANFNVFVEKQDGSGWRKASGPEGSKNRFTWMGALKKRNDFKQKGQRTKIRFAPGIRRRHKVLVWDEAKDAWVEHKFLGVRSFPKLVAFRERNKLRRAGKKTKIREVLDKRDTENRLIETWLRGDLDFDRDVMVALAKTGRDINTAWYVRSGKRTYEEQAALFAKYGPGRAARPGTSNHETGRAADVGRLRDNVDIGEVPGARKALLNNGLALVVPGEDWHVEPGSKHLG